MSKKGSIKGESINGAIFELTYYDNTDNDASGEAYRTWYFMTKNGGKLDCSDADYFLAGTNYLNDRTKIKSDDLYKDAAGGVIYPVGTYVLKEIQAADGYKLDGGEMWLTNEEAVSVSDGIGIVLKRNDELVDNKYGVTRYSTDGTEVKKIITADNFSISATNDGGTRIPVKKLDGSTGKPLVGVTFKLVGDDGQVYEKTTDANGEIVFEELIPQHYVLTEIGTVDGRTLLVDNIDITMPLYMTEDEIKKTGADISKAYYSMIEDKYFFTEVAYTIGNTTTLHVPMTGVMSSPKIYIPLFCGLALAGAASVYVFGRNKRRKQQAEA